MIQLRTYQQKNVALLIGALIGLLVIYQFAIRKTTQLIQQNTIIRAKLVDADRLPEKLGRLKQQLHIINKHFGLIQEGQLHTSDLILEAAGDFCKEHNLLLSRFEPPETYQQSGLEVLTIAIHVQGKFKEIVQLMHYLEAQLDLARIASAKFELLKNRRNKLTYLQAKIYLQTLNPQKSES